MVSEVPDHDSCWHLSQFHADAFFSGRRVNEADYASEPSCKVLADVLDGVALAHLDLNGDWVITRAAHDLIPRLEVLTALSRHARGDWGTLPPEDARANEEALAGGGRLLSAYASTDGQRFWILTEADRSATTVLLPEDY